MLTQILFSHKESYFKLTLQQSLHVVFLFNVFNVSPTEKTSKWTLGLLAEKSK